MARHLVIGNGKMLLNLDHNSYIRDIYYPYVGQLNHVGGQYCRLGIWTEGQFSWLEDSAWESKLDYVEDSLVTNVSARHGGLQTELQMNDGIHQRECIYLKRVVIRNLSDREREYRLFFHQDLMIDGSEVGDTAAYYPDNHTLFHYKRSSYFMFNGFSDEGGMTQYSTGIKRFHSAEGTWRDAEDGILMGNAIAQGSVDSTISFRTVVPAGGEKTVYYWMSIGKSLEEVKELNQYVQENHPEKLLSRIVIYWNHWLGRAERDLGDLPPEVGRMFRLSLLMVRTQTDERGAIIAANDTDILQYNRDHYSYMWPRDGALVADAMSLAGYQSVIAPFFHFCSQALTPEGYLYHKFNPDGTVGSSWHPYMVQGTKRLPIQEDETALVLFALWRDYKRHQVIELPQSLYSSLIRKSAAFLSSYMEHSMSLPKPSYDLWEERYGIWTYTTASVYGGLMAASFFTELFGDYERSDHYRRTAEEIKQGMLTHLWDEDSGRFARGLVQKDGRWVKDMTLESSLFAVLEFGVLPASDHRVVGTMEAIREGLAVRTDVGGIARYTNDYYFQQSGEIDRVPGNPWIICTLWVANFEIESATSLADLEAPRRTLEWVVRQSLESGVLPEQLNPYDGSPLSVAPLTWSHATFVQSVSKYAAKYKELAGSAGAV
ncbi:MULTISPECIES: glycoside hydrolase family 15 protein [unclassified Paenibacillus]|uniref:glycoside hydrolase family 15 protein n=1 Tax=unclassified Paenibacillus TaxID=185978 RepID=UPI000956E190|nr:MULTISPECIES: glycoside hydrolase family 15 protein [unclassified Paenibacillus]ASS64993.1 glycoside hydrolase family 15 protein [Paenibacillus sp. RUD330]SIQ52122.1 Glucoamylase (glucan-1,4-alpha-glucosidase), GH15 family [Paenibacillus sp. RU4X]SIQ74594.1 Glucoamylase (glucan-1,4-alpha-glucosidase), GH15 family [Paenibacillus sp. RU4T]